MSIVICYCIFIQSKLTHCFISDSLKNHTTTTFTLALLPKLIHIVTTFTLGLFLVLNNMLLVNQVECSDLCTITKTCNRNFHTNSLPVSLLLHRKKICFYDMNLFATFTITPLSTFRPLPLTHCYRPTMTSQGFDNP